MIMIAGGDNNRLDLLGVSVLWLQTCFVKQVIDDGFFPETPNFMKLKICSPPLQGWSAAILPIRSAPFRENWVLLMFIASVTPTLEEPRIT
jgi:hypothetical protein